MSCALEHARTHTHSLKTGSIGGDGSDDSFVVWQQENISGVLFSHFHFLSFIPRSYVTFNRIESFIFVSRRLHSIRISIDFVILGPCLRMCGAVRTHRMNEIILIIDGLRLMSV